MQALSKTPVIIVTGFLGSGKTTLLNRLLANGEYCDSAVIVNEFGTIGLDHRIIASARDNILLLDGGCLCCVMVDSLRETLADLYARRATDAVPQFSRVIIETSGLADPGPILQTIMKDSLVSPLFSIAGVLTLVDALHCRAQLAEHPETGAQIAFADKLILTKVKNCPHSELEFLRGQLAGLNATADLALLDEGCSAVEHLFDLEPHSVMRPSSSTPLHDRAIISESFRIERSVSWAGVAAWVDHLGEKWGEDLLRCKALLRLHGSGQVLVQGVRKVFEVIRADALDLVDDTGVAVCIGRNLDRTELQRGLSWLDAPEGIALPASADFAPWDEMGPK